MKNNISDSALLVGEITMGEGNYFGPGSLIIGPISIGNNNFFGPNCVIGTPPQDDILNANEHKDITCGKRVGGNRIQIGSNNIIREFVTVHQGLTSRTEIGDHCYLMSYAHIAHDCKIHNKVKIANNVQMGGYSTVFEGTYLGLSAVLHQFSVIGAHAMIGMGSLVTRNIPPASLATGSPARIVKVNQVALEKIGMIDFDWTVDYIKLPTLEHIHPSLQTTFESYHAVLAEKIEERKQITNFRKSD